MPRAKTAWKRQLILMLICDTASRGILDDTREHLETKASEKSVACDVLELDTKKIASEEEVETLAKKIAWLGDGRLYIVGHGDWANQKIGNWDAATVAKLVAAEGAAFQLVSLTGCRVGRDKLSSENPRQPGVLGVYVANSMDSFASKFHYSLGQDHGLKIDVYARVFGTQADKGPTILTMVDDVYDIEPDKLKAGPIIDKVVPAMADKKLRFFWNGATQQREWVLQGSGAAAVFD